MLRRDALFSLPNVSSPSPSMQSRPHLLANEPTPSSLGVPENRRENQSSRYRGNTWQLLASAARVPMHTQLAQRLGARQYSTMIVLHAVWLASVGRLAVWAEDGGRPRTGTIGDISVSPSAPTYLTPRTPSEIIVTVGRSGRDVVPCFWQRGGPLRLANDKLEQCRCDLIGTYQSGNNAPPLVVRPVQHDPNNGAL